MSLPQSTFDSGNLFKVALFAFTSYAYTQISLRRSSEKIAQVPNESGDISSKTSSVKDVISPSYQVVFVLGGPGSGKGTQCSRLVKDLGVWTHLSAGDLLRAERSKKDSDLATIINEKISTGQIVPSEITVRLIKNAMDSDPKGNTRFLIDGFPRSEENNTAWESIMDVADAPISTVEFVLFLDCPEDTMTSRLLERGLTSGRDDDNLDVIRKRFATFRNESMPIVAQYEAKGKLRKIIADRSVDAVYAEVSALFQNI